MTTIVFIDINQPKTDRYPCAICTDGHYSHQDLTPAELRDLQNTHHFLWRDRE